MNDNEIMKALRCCADRYCKGCSEQSKANCRESIAALAWDLIYRQKSEIEELREIVFMDRTEAIKLLKSEAIKEFAERLKAETTYHEDECGVFLPWVDCRDIDNLVKEMTGEKT